MNSLIANFSLQSPVRCWWGELGCCLMNEGRNWVWGENLGLWARGAGNRYGGAVTAQSASLIHAMVHSNTDHLRHHGDHHGDDDDGHLKAQVTCDEHSGDVNCVMVTMLPGQRPTDDWWLARYRQHTSHTILWSVVPACTGPQVTPGVPRKFPTWGVRTWDMRTSGNQDIQSICQYVGKIF